MLQGTERPSSSWLLVQRQVPWVPATQASSLPTPSIHFTDEHGEPVWIAELQASWLWWGWELGGDVHW